MAESEETAFVVEREEQPTKGRYFIRLDGGEAEMNYTRAGSTNVIEHTGVPVKYRGRGIAVAMVRRAVEDARAEDRRLLPMCPFARDRIERNPEWRELLEP